MAADQAELDRVRTELQSQAAATTGHLRTRKWIRGGLGLALTGTVAVGGLLFRRSVLQRRRRCASTCPLCLGNIGLKTDANHRPARNSTELIHCGNLISRAPRVACGYSFRQVYRPMTKLCFPTLGVPKAGKTHWLTMLYWQLNRGNYPRAVQFEKIQAAHSGGVDDFDALIEQILYSRMGTAATQRDRVPQPVVFNFRDRDPWGCSNLLVNVFDYSGEVTSDMGVEDYRRRRALEADGFVFFLDPTFPPEPQTKALADFREDLRLVKGVQTGKKVRLPIALCLTKIDLLAAQSFALADGRDAVAQFYAEMAQVDPSGEAMTLAVIEARSRLVSRLRETIWPGWEIERTDPRSVRIAALVLPANAGGPGRARRGGPQLEDHRPLRPAGAPVMAAGDERLQSFGVTIDRHGLAPCVSIQRDVAEAGTRIPRSDAQAILHRAGQFPPAAALVGLFRGRVQGDRPGGRPHAGHSRLHDGIAGAERALRRNQRVPSTTPCRMPGGFRIPRRRHSGFRR